jgi:hypothetical protein
MHAMFEAKNFNAPFTARDHAGTTDITAVGVFQPQM